MRERYPEVARALQNAGAQAREAQLRREAGSRRETRARVAAIKSRLAQLPSDDAAGLDFVWENAQANASDELMRAMAASAIETFNPSAEERATLEAAIANQRDGEGLRHYAMELVSMAADRVGRRSMYDLSIDDVPSDSALARSAREREARRVEAERQAAAIEGRPRRTPAPPTPAGRPVGTNSYDLNNPFEVLRANRDGYFAYDDAAAAALERAFDGR